MALLLLSFVISLAANSSPYTIFLDSTDTGFLAFLIAGWYFTSRSNRLYEDRLQENQSRELFKTTSNIFWQGLLAIVFVFFVKEKDYSRSFVMTYMLLQLLFIPFGKIVLKRFYLMMYKQGRLRKKALVIGGGETSQLFCKYLREHKHHGYQMVRYLPGEIQLMNSAPKGHPKLFSLQVSGQDVSDIREVDEVFISEDHNAAYSTKELAKVLSTFAVRLRIIPNMYNMFSAGRYSFSIMGGFPVLSYRSEPLEDAYNQILKRAFDVVFSLLVVVLIFSWLFPILAILIKLDSKGPVFYKQERWGKRNRPFWCLKFRSMQVQAPNEVNGKFNQATKNDSRITKVGRILRKTSLDELPQFFNVLSGEMSVVGPRPHASLMNEESIAVVENYMVRHQAKPGITGWAQVNGLRGESNDPKLLKARIQHDIWYIENWTFLLDVRITFLTFWKMVVGDKQAY